MRAKFIHPPQGRRKFIQKFFLEESGLKLGRAAGNRRLLPSHTGNGLGRRGMVSGFFPFTVQIPVYLGLFPPADKSRETRTKTEETSTNSKRILLIFNDFDKINNDSAWFSSESGWFPLIPRDSMLIHTKSSQFLCNFYRKRLDSIYIYI